MAYSTTFNGKPCLELNAVQKVVVRGVAKDNLGNAVDVTILRARPEPAELELFSHPIPEWTKKLATLPPSSLPPEGNVTLTLEVNELLSKNDRNLVYAVHAVNADAVGFYVPPLVIKVAAFYKGLGLSKEAGMYNDLESLQGIVLPRCYGYFESAVDHTKMTILPWDGTDCTYPRGPHNFNRYQPPHPAAPFNMILLERLEPITTTSAKDADWIESDLTAMCSDLAQLGVYPKDWRLRNTMYAPKSPPGLPGRPSARNGRVYGVRMIDLEHSCRANMSTDQLTTLMRSEAVESIVNYFRYHDMD